MRTRALVFAAFAFASPVVACATSGSSGGSSHLAIDPRYEAVHNALAGAGMAEVGAIIRGAVAKGGEVRLPIEVRPPCTTFVVLGAANGGDLDATVVDAAGRVLGRDATTDSEPVVKACVGERGPYTLVVKSNGGSGDFLVGQYATEGALALASAAKIDGTCEGPYPLADGKVSGTTAHAHQELEGSCASTGGRELVYRLELKERRHTIIDVDPKQFDAVLYVRKDTCADDGAEVACNDDSGSDRHSHIDETFDPGVYFVIVDGLGTDSGAFQMTVETKPAEPLSRACGRAPSLVFGSPVHGDWEGAVAHLDDSCIGPERGPDYLYKLTVPPPGAARVRVSEKSDGAPPVLELRESCSEDARSLDCTSVGETDAITATTVALLDPGTYVVAAEAGSSHAKGTFELTADIDREGGEGAEGDTCRGAIPLRASGDVIGDTFHARDDGATSCGGQGAPDVVYRIEAAHRTRLVASLSKEEGQHVLSLARACSAESVSPAGNPANIQKIQTKDVCGKTLATTLDPGSWFLTVDGRSAADFGQFSLAVDLHDARPREAECKNVPMIKSGVRVSGDTSGGRDAFTNQQCGRLSYAATIMAAHTALLGAAAALGEIDPPENEPDGSPDRVYRFSIKERSSVTALVETAGWPAEVALRRACEDGGDDVEMMCNGSNGTPSVQVDTQLDPGTYFVVVDGQGAGNGGKFTLLLTAHPESDPSSGGGDDE